MVEPFLHASDIVVRFGGLTAVDCVSIAVDRGEIAGLIGPNGAGKTTTFGALLGLLPVAGGTVHIGGHDVTRWPAYRRARLGVGRTFQKLELFGSMTVRENLLYAAEAVSIASSPWRLLRRFAAVDTTAVDETLDWLGLTDHADEPAASLPIGLARLVEFGRALSTDPALLLLDEPSSGLDPTETARFGDFVRVAVRERGCGVLVIEHDMSLVSDLCERLQVIDFGKPISAGATANVLADPAVQAAYLGTDHAA